MMIYKILLGLLLCIGFCQRLPAREYDFKLFTFDEVNKLRQSSVLKRIKILEKVTNRYEKIIVNYVKMRNYKNAIEHSSKMIDVLDYALEDIRLCIENCQLRNKKELRKYEVSLRKNLSHLKGAKKAVPYQIKEDFDPLIGKLTYCRTLLFKFINNMDAE